MRNYAGIRPSVKGMQRMLLVASVLVFTVGITLVLLPGQTAQYFAWTIDPPLTAAFLGAAYWASCVLEYLASRETIWARARVAVPAVFVFTFLTLVATLLHIDRFHFGSSFGLITQIGTWTWLAVYAIVPPVMLVLWLRQLRLPAGDPRRRLPIAGWLKILIGLQAAIMLLLGAGLFLAPLSTAPLWPWKLTALTGRAVGAWCLGLGIGAAQVVWEDDWWRVPSAVAGYSTFAVLELFMLVRFSGTLDWSGPRAWAYVAFLLSVLVVGLAGWRELRRAERHDLEPVSGLAG